MGMVVESVSRPRPLILTIVSCLALSVIAVASTAQAERELSIDEGYFEILDEEGNILTATGLVVSIDDIFIDSSNRSYRIESITEQKAQAKFLSVVELPKIDSEPAAGVVGWFKGLVGLADKDPSGGGEYLAQDRSRPIAIYCTHSDESYVPTSGTASKEDTHGDVYQVAEVLKANVEKSGGKAVLSYEQHHPHDGAAYERSRRTAMQLMREQPLALIDVHRDAVPAHVYEASVAGKNIAAVKLVVGRQNANSGANLEFAKYLKAVADKMYPGLVEGIFWGSGSYNQDLSPRSVLFEAGAHTNTLEQAKQGMQLMGEVLATAVYGATPDGQERAPEPRTGTTARTVFWVVVVVLVVGAIYLFVNEGGFEGIKKRVKSFTSKEMLGQSGDDSDENGSR